ncbi:hypothetical protein F5Y10DRAFT_269205 [Nemania abortiva]|nr:hypothetical protein F5Y10DRAFT_269205 [Nemania abortiva]
MSLNRLEIVYITGATACGKGTLGSRLARHFNFYHISMGDLRRAHGQSLRAGVPWMSEAIKQCIREGREIPEELSRDYDVLPAVLQLHNRKVNGTLGWTVDLASAMINEEIAEARRVSRDWRVKYTGIIIDGHPLTGGRISEDKVPETLRGSVTLTEQDYPPKTKSASKLEWN